jgi:predicted Zn-dependent protease with MMP-like domain
MTPDYASLPAPGLDDFQTIAEAAYAALPEEFRALTRDVGIRIEDFAEADVLRELGIENEFDLMGLFQGIGLAQDNAVPMTGQMPNQVVLYRRPVLDYWCENEETLGHVITHVLVHEIGHHFGLSDEDMENIEAAADQPA